MYSKHSPNMKLKRVSLMMWILFALLAVLVILMPMIFSLEIMGILSDGSFRMAADILAYAWVPIGLIVIILIYWAMSLRISILEGQIPAPEDTTVKRWNVTGTALQIDSSFTMDLHLSETSYLLQQSPGTQTGIQQQLSRDV
jgi:hypothetical protein